MTHASLPGRTQVAGFGPTGRLGLLSATQRGVHRQTQRSQMVSTDCIPLSLFKNDPVTASTSCWSFKQNSSIF